MPLRRTIYGFLFACAAVGFAGCESTKRIYTAEREDDIPGVVSAVEWRTGERIENSRGEVDAEGNLIRPAVDSEAALKLATDALARIVKDPARWKYGYCRVVNFQKGCYGWSVRFDRRDKFDESKAGDGFVKLYVLLDGTVVMPSVIYER